MVNFDEGLPVLEYPAPWTLEGRGIILPYWLNRHWMGDYFPHYSGRFGVAMWVDYYTSPVGPYREWLFIPGKRINAKGKHYCVSHIVVDSPESMLAGRANWGMPKELGHFSWSVSHRDYRLKADFENSHLQLYGIARGPLVPIHSGILPFSLFQYWEQQNFWTKPHAVGQCQWLQVKNCRYVGDSLPNLGEQRLLTAMVIPHFRMTFPVAETTIE